MFKVGYLLKKKIFKRRREKNADWDCAGEKGVWVGGGIGEVFAGE